MHPDLRARMARIVQPAGAAIGLVLRDFVGMVDFAMVDPAGMDVEGEAEQLLAHDRAFKMPAGRALAPGAVPFHLPRFARRGLAPDGEIGGVALALDRVDAPLAFIRDGAGKTTVIRNSRNVEIEPAIEFVAVLVCDLLAPGDHRLDIFGRARMLFGLDVQPREVAFEILLIELCDVPGGLALLRRHALHLVFALIRIRGEVADIGDVDDVGEPIALPLQHAPQRVGEDIGAHIADMLVIIDRRPAGIDARLARVDGLEDFDCASQRVEQLERRVGHAGPDTVTSSQRKTGSGAIHHRTVLREARLDNGLPRRLRLLAMTAGWVVTTLPTARSRPAGRV